MLGMLDQFAALGGGGDKEDPIAEMFSEKKAIAKAAAMGEGVTFEKSEPIANGANQGARITYRFTDINQLKISPGEGMNDLSPMMAQAAAAAEKNPVKFNLADGTLSIIIPVPEKPAAPAADTPEEPAPAGDQRMEGMMKQMLGDMKVSFKLVIEPGIAETNATHCDGNTITLVDMEMAKLLENPETVKKLSAASKTDSSASFETLKGLDGVTMETKPTVTVKFK